MKKFLGNTKKVCVVKDMKSFNDTTVADIMNCDILIVNFTVLCNDTYYTRLARMSGKSPNSVPAGKKGGRHFDSVYESCLESLPNRVSQLLKDGSVAFDSIEADAKKCEAQENEDGLSFRLDGKKSVYKNGDQKKNVSAKGTKSAKEVDPWCLKGTKDYIKMRSPPLELFHWRRIIVDEFTYLLEKVERQRPLTLVRKLSSEYRWYLSGTPRHENFDDISLLAKLLGVHLGVDEALPGKKVGKSGKGNESTGAENMSQFLETKSHHWHQNRRAKAQEFLDTFVRQNVAEHDEIPWEEKELLVDLPPVERAIYLELETHLKSLEMNAQTAKMSKKKSRSDRENRMQQVRLLFELWSLTYVKAQLTIVSYFPNVRFFKNQPVPRKPFSNAAHISTSQVNQRPH